MQEGGSSKHPIQWRSVEELMGASAHGQNIAQAVLSHTLTSGVDKNEAGFSRRTALRVSIWAFAISAIIGLTASLAFVFNRHQLEQNTLKSQHRLLEVMLNAHRAAILGEHEQALWILHTIKELGGLDPFLGQEISITENILQKAAKLKELDAAMLHQDTELVKQLFAQLSEKKEQTSQDRLFERALRYRVRLAEHAQQHLKHTKAQQAPRLSVQKTMAIDEESLFKEGLSLFELGDTPGGCQKMEIVAQRATMGSVWQQKASSFWARKCHQSVE